MKKQLINIKNFVQDGLTVVSRGEKSDVLSNDLVNAEKKVDIMRQACLSTEKKIASCLRGIGSGPDIEKRIKKLPELGLSQCLIECGERLGSDSVLGNALTNCGEIEKSIGKELVQYEIEVEQTCLSTLNGFMENDIPNVIKSRKHLTRATNERDIQRQRYQTALKQSQQTHSSGGNVAKVETLKADLEEAALRVDQCRDLFETEVFSFLSRESDIAQVYLDYFRLQALYHEKALGILQEFIPKLNSIIENASQKPLFGSCLEDHLRVSNREIASVIETCVALLLCNINEEGLFRIPGSTSKVRKLKSALNANLVDINDYINDPHTVAGCLKSYLRELPEPLLTFQLYQAWIDAAKQNDSNIRLQAFHSVCSSLPRDNFNNLRYLVKFLAKCSQNSDMNKMTASNIAIALAPSLIWAPNSENDDNGFGANMTAANYHNILVEALVTYADWFFRGDVEFVTIPLGELKQPLNGDHSVPSTCSMTTENHHPVPTPRSNTGHNRSVKKPAPPAPSSGQAGFEREGSLRKNHISGTQTVARTPTQRTSLILGSVKKNDNIDTTNQLNMTMSTFIGDRVTASLDRRKLRNSQIERRQMTTGGAEPKSNFHSGNGRPSRPPSLEKPNIPPPDIPAQYQGQANARNSVERPPVPPPNRPTLDRSIILRNSSAENLCDTVSDSGGGDDSQSSSPVNDLNVSSLSRFDNHFAKREAITFADDSDEENLISCLDSYAASGGRSSDSPARMVETTKSTPDSLSDAECVDTQSPVVLRRPPPRPPALRTKNMNISENTHL